MHTGPSSSTHITTSSSQLPTTATATVIDKNPNGHTQEDQDKNTIISVDSNNDNNNNEKSSTSIRAARKASGVSTVEGYAPIAPSSHKTTTTTPSYRAQHRKNSRMQTSHSALPNDTDSDADAESVAYTLKSQKSQISATNTINSHYHRSRQWQSRIDEEPMNETPAAKVTYSTNPPARQTFIDSAVKELILAEEQTHTVFKSYTCIYLL